MIKKEITMNDGKNYRIGFKEIGTYDKVIECHILKKGVFGEKSLFMKSHWKGLCPNYKQMAQWTILDYEREYKQKQGLLEGSWV
jgi:hypothetical protein